MSSFLNLNSQRSDTQEMSWLQGRQIRHKGGEGGEQIIENGGERSQGHSKGLSNGTFPRGNVLVGSQCEECRGHCGQNGSKHSHFTICLLRPRSTTLHNFCYPSALTGGEAGLKWRVRWSSCLPALRFCSEITLVVPWGYLHSLPQASLYLLQHTVPSHGLCKRKYLCVSPSQ